MQVSLAVDQAFWGRVLDSCMFFVTLQFLLLKLGEPAFLSVLIFSVIMLLTENVLTPNVQHVEKLVRYVCENIFNFQCTRDY